MRIKIIINCPKCGYEYTFKNNIPTQGSYNNFNPSFKCNCGYMTELNFDIETKILTKWDGIKE